MEKKFDVDQSLGASCWKDQEILDLKCWPSTSILGLGHESCCWTSSNTPIHVGFLGNLETRSIDYQKYPIKLNI
jgi:hypothetical protein